MIGGLACAAAVAIADGVVHGHTVLITLLVVAPLIAAVRADRRGVAVVAACSVVLALALGEVDHIFGSVDHLFRVVVVAAGGAIAVTLAGTRARLEGARFRYSLIADAGVILGSELDWEVALIELARLCARRLADWCFVFIVQDDGRILQLAVAHRDPQRQQLAWELLSRYPLDPERAEGPAKVIRSGRSDLQPKIDHSLLEVIAADEENMRLLEALELRSAMIVPLATRDRTIGAIAFASAESERVYGPEDLALAEDLASRAAIAFDNARLYDRVREAQAVARRSRDQLQGILDGVADAVTAQDVSGRVIYANDAAAWQLGMSSAGELIDRDPAEITPAYRMYDENGDDLPVERLPGRRALAGENPEPMLLRYRLPGSGEDGWSLIKATAVTDDAGKPVLAINVIEDVTEQRQREEEQRFLAESSKVLASSFVYEETFPQVARLAVRDLADWCAIELVERDGTLRTVAFAHRDPSRDALVAQLMNRYPMVPRNVDELPEALLSGEPMLASELTDDELARLARDPDHMTALLELGLRSAITVPMRSRGETIGVLSMLAGDSGIRYREPDLALAEDLASRCAMAVDNARLYRERSRIARTLQESLLPPLLPEMNGIDVAARFRAAGQGIEVGGDFYDLFELGRDAWAVAIGDVCGKGSEAATITALARYTVRAAAMRQQEPSQILGLLNEALLRQRSDRRFCTVLYGQLSQNGAGVSFEFASGGHPLPLLLRAGGAGAEVGQPGTLLGIVSDPKLVDGGVKLAPGDALVLYTDGVTDAAAPKRIHTPEQLAAMVGVPDGLPADAIAERMMRAALEGAEGEPRDDIAILVLKVPEG